MDINKENLSFNSQNQPRQSNSFLSDDSLFDIGIPIPNDIVGTIDSLQIEEIYDLSVEDLIYGFEGVTAQGEVITLGAGSQFTYEIFSDKLNEIVVGDLQAQDFLINPGIMSYGEDYGLEISSEIAARTNRTQLVFVDLSVEGYENLLAGITPEAEVFLLDPNRDGVEQISEVLEERTEISAIHIVSHGEAGTVQLGATNLSLDTLGNYESSLQQWKNALTSEADLLFYGCNVAEGTVGVEFVNQMGNLTGADVAASDDLTGNANFGGDWDLEFVQGSIESLLLFQNSSVTNFEGVLDLKITNQWSNIGSQVINGSGTIDFSSETSKPEFEVVNSITGEIKATREIKQGSSNSQKQYIRFKGFTTIKLKDEDYQVKEESGKYSINKVPVTPSSQPSNSETKTDSNSKLNLINATTGDDKLDGTDKDDYIYGGRGNDTINAKLGNDFLEGAPGNDTLIGGEGNDTYVFETWKKEDKLRNYGNDTITEQANEGTDTLNFSGIKEVSQTFTFKDTGIDVKSADGGSEYNSSFKNGSLNSVKNIEKVIGASNQNTFKFEDGWLSQYSNNENLKAFEIQINENDQITELDFSSVTNQNLIFTISQNISQNRNPTVAIKMSLGDNKSHFLEFERKLKSGQSVDSLLKIVGGTKENSYKITGDVDLFSTIQIKNPEKSVNLLDYRSYTGKDITADLSQKTEAKISQVIGGNGTDNIKGNGLDNSISGGNDNDFITGEQGNDILQGNAGNDTLDGSLGNDTLEGDAGNDTLVVSVGYDVLSGGADSDTYQFSGEWDIATVIEKNVEGKITDHGDVLDFSKLNKSYTHILNGDTLVSTEGILKDGVVYINNQPASINITPKNSNPVQTIEHQAFHGTFRLKYGNEETQAIARDASASTLEKALESLKIVEDVSVKKLPLPSSEDKDTQKWEITFKKLASVKDVKIEDKTPSNSQTGQNGSATQKVWELTHQATHGSFKLKNRDKITQDISYEASDQDIQKAIKDLGDISATVTKIANGWKIENSSITDLTFENINLRTVEDVNSNNVQQLIGNNADLFTKGNASTSIETPQEELKGWTLSTGEVRIPLLGFTPGQTAIRKEGQLALEASSVIHPNGRSITSATDLDALAKNLENDVKFTLRLDTSKGSEIYQVTVNKEFLNKNSAELLSNDAKFVKLALEINGILSGNSTHGQLKLLTSSEIPNLKNRVSVSTFNKSGIDVGINETGLAFQVKDAEIQSISILPTAPNTVVVGSDAEGNSMLHNIEEIKASKGANTFVFGNDWGEIPGEDSVLKTLDKYITGGLFDGLGTAYRNKNRELIIDTSDMFKNHELVLDFRAVTEELNFTFEHEDGHTKLTINRETALGIPIYGPEFTTIEFDKIVITHIGENTTVYGGRSANTFVMDGSVQQLGNEFKGKLIGGEGRSVALTDIILDDLSIAGIAGRVNDILNLNFIPDLSVTNTIDISDVSIGLAEESGFQGHSLYSVGILGDNLLQSGGQLLNKVLPDKWGKLPTDRAENLPGLISGQFENIDNITYGAGINVLVGSDMFSSLIPTSLKDKSELWDFLSGLLKGWGGNEFALGGAGDVFSTPSDIFSSIKDGSGGKGKARDGLSTALQSAFGNLGVHGLAGMTGGDTYKFEGIWGIAGIAEIPDPVGLFGGDTLDFSGVNGDIDITVESTGVKGLNKVTAIASNPFFDWIGKTLGQEKGYSIVYATGIENIVGSGGTTTVKFKGDAELGGTIAPADGGSIALDYSEFNGGDDEKVEADFGAGRDFTLIPEWSLYVLDFPSIGYQYGNAEGFSRSSDLEIVDIITGLFDVTIDTSFFGKNFAVSSVNQVTGSKFEDIFTGASGDDTFVLGHGGFDKIDGKDDDKNADGDNPNGGQKIFLNAKENYQTGDSVLFTGYEQMPNNSGVFIDLSRQDSDNNTAEAWKIAEKNINDLRVGDAEEFRIFSTDEDWLWSTSTLNIKDVAQPTIAENKTYSSHEVELTFSDDITVDEVWNVSVAGKTLQYTVREGDTINIIADNLFDELPADLTYIAMVIQLLLSRKMAVLLLIHQIQK